MAVVYLLMAGKIPCHCSVLGVFDVKEMTLRPIKYFVFGLTYIFDITDNAFQAVY